MRGRREADRGRWSEQGDREGKCKGIGEATNLSRRGGWENSTFVAGKAQTAEEKGRTATKSVKNS